MKVTKNSMDEKFLQDSNYPEALIGINFCGVHAFDKDFRYRLWSPVMEAISGMRANEVIGRNAFAVFPFLKQTNESAMFEAAVEGQSSQSRESPFDVPSTGRKGFFDGNYQPLLDKNGNIVGGLATVRDVTTEVMSKRFSIVLANDPEAESDAETATITAGNLTTALGHVILQRRKSIGLSQEELASRADLHRTYICDIERGERNIAVKNVVRIAQALGVPLWVLLGWAETNIGDPDS